MIKDITHIGSHITFHCVLRHSQNFSTRNQALHRMRGTERKKKTITIIMLIITHFGTNNKI